MEIQEDMGIKDIGDKLLILLVLEEVKECALNFDKCIFINSQS